MKSLIIQAGQNSFVKNLFGAEPVRRLTLSMTTNEEFRRKSNMDAFHYQTFGLERLEITPGDGVPVPGTPFDMRNGRMRTYYNTICSLGFSAGSGGNGINFKNFEDHFVLVFDPTSTREASKSLTLFPELTGTVSHWNYHLNKHCLKRCLNFSSLPNDSVKYSLICNGTLPKTHYFNKLVRRMDNVTLEKLVQICNHLSETCGVCSANNFPAMKQGESFQIVNTEGSWRPGRQWILLADKKTWLDVERW